LYTNKLTCNFENILLLFINKVINYPVVPDAQSWYNRSDFY